MVELFVDGTYWNINTAGVFKTSYGKNRREVYNRHTTEKQSAETAGASQDVPQSGTDTPSRMNTPILSEGKGNEKFSDAQERALRVEVALEEARNVYDGIVDAKLAELFENPAKSRTIPITLRGTTDFSRIVD